MVNQQTGPKETKQFWNKTWEQKEHKRKSEWINNILKNHKNTWRRAQGKIKSILTKNKFGNWKTPGQDGIYGFLFKNSCPSTTDWLDLQLRKVRKSKHTTLDDEGENYPDPDGHAHQK